MRKDAMKILFVHGMGATPWDAFPTLRRLRKAGHATATFAYFASVETLASIQARLVARLSALARDGDYALIGHSLGGVLLRHALCSLPAGTRQPRHLFLVGSPMVATRTNIYLNRFRLYKLLFGECGQLVASPQRMAAIGTPDIPLTCVAGTLGFPGRRQPFGGAANDGIVQEAELRPELFTDVVRLPAHHPLLPAHRQLAHLVHQRLS